VSATGGSTLDGTGALVRLILRLDRIRLPVWVVAILGLVYASASAVQGIYSTQAELDAYARTMGNSPAAIAFSGPPIALNTAGGVTVFEVNQSAMIAVALMAIFLVVRHTRGDEEEGRTELLRSTVVGRHAPTVAALFVVGAASAVVGAGVTVSLISLGLPVGGSVAYGVSLGLLGLAFTAIGACAAQVSSNGRAAIGMSLVALATSFVLRAMGDVGNGVLSWLSPMGWMQAVRPFGDERWWPMFVLLAFTGVMLGVAAGLTSHRDLGAGLVQPRPGPAGASPRLGSATGLATRLQRGSIVAWTAGAFLFGAIFGGFGPEMEEFVRNQPDLAEVFLQASGASIVEQYFVTVLLLLAIGLSGFTVSSALRLRAEESSGRAESLLSTGLSRSRWALGGLAVTVAGTLVVFGAGGLGTGLFYGLAGGDMGEMPTLLSAALAFAPAALVLGGVAVLLFGQVPRATMAAWAVLGTCFVFAYLGVLLDIPRWLRNLSPFEHVTGAPVEPITVTPLLVLTGIALALAGIGLLRWQRRDIG
jgi:polyether ionophore transport system permease protein